MSKKIEVLRYSFLKWEDAFLSMCLNINLWNTNVMVCGGITKNGLSKGKVDLCGVSILRLRGSSVFYVQYYKWIQVNVLRR